MINFIIQAYYCKKTQINIFVTFYQKFKFFIDKINEI